MTVPVDGPYDLWFTPESSAHFTELGIDALDYLWLCNEASGNIATTLGSLTLSTNGTGHLYQQSITGWDRKAVGSTNDGDTCAWRVLSGSGPNPATQSIAWIGLFALPTASGSSVRNFFSPKGAAPQIILGLLSSDKLRLNVNGVSVDSTYTYRGDGVHWLAISYNRTAGTVALYTEKEKLTGTYDAGITDGNKGIGGVTGNTTCVYRCLWLGAATGTNAERNWSEYLLELGAYSTVGSAAGTSTVTGAGGSIAAATGTIAGTSTASAISATVLPSTGSIAGTSTSSAESVATVGMVGSIEGASTVLGVGATIRRGKPFYESLRKGLSQTVDVTPDFSREPFSWTKRR